MQASHLGPLASLNALQALVLTDNEVAPFSPWRGSAPSTPSTAGTTR